MHLKFVPCKELMSISRLLKAMPSQDCCVTAIQALVKILKFDPIFKDVYREVGKLRIKDWSKDLKPSIKLNPATLGMVEALTELLEHLSESCQPRDQDQEVTIASFNLIEVTLGALGDILAGCSANATVFRESDGTKIILQLAKVVQNWLKLDSRSSVFRFLSFSRLTLLVPLPLTCSDLWYPLVEAAVRMI